MSEIRLSPAGIAALGAAAACWDEGCEGNSAAHGRPGFPVVATLLALAQNRHATVAELLLALVTGYEIGARAGELWRIPPGWHVDGGWHSLAVAAGVARMVSGPGSIQPAIEAAACQIPASLYLPIAVGSVVRNTYPSHAVLLGIMAASAASAGFDMPSGVLEEGRKLILRASSQIAPTPAGQWTVLEGYLKLFVGVRHTHYGVEAALRLRKNPAFSLEKISAIKLQVYGEAVQYCGNRAPRTVIQAQFSLSYSIAAALVLGELGPDAYDDVANPAIARLEKLVVIVVDPERVRRGANLTIDFGKIQLVESAENIVGDPARPITKDDVIRKFHRYVEPNLGRNRAQALVDFFIDGDGKQAAYKCFELAS